MKTGNKKVRSKNEIPSKNMASENDEENKTTHQTKRHPNLLTHNSNLAKFKHTAIIKQRKPQST